MRYLFLFCILFGKFSPTIAQDVFPAEAAPIIDSLLNQAYYYQGIKDSINTRTQVKLIDEKIETLVNRYPAYTGVIRMFQAFYIFDKQEQQLYHTKGIALLKAQSKLPIEEFASAFNNLLQLHYKNNRMPEWLVADTIFRASIATGTTKEHHHYAIANYVDKQMKEKNYQLAKILATYDYYLLSHHQSKDPMDKLSLHYADWIIVNADLEIWLELPYEKRFPGEYTKQLSWNIPLSGDNNTNDIPNIDFKKSFGTLLSRIKELKPEMVTNNTYGSKNFKSNLRRGYYHLYSSLIKGYYNWAVSEHKEGQVILALKEFIINELLPEEMEAAIKAGQRPAIATADYIDLVDKLASLYEQIGNGFEQEVTAVRGFEVIISSKLFTTDEAIQAIFCYRKNLATASRLQNKFEASLESTRLMKRLAPLPDSSTLQSLPKWETFMSARVEEVYTLLANQQYQSVKDSMNKLFAAISPIDDDTEGALLYTTRGWSHLQFITAIMAARVGNWQEEMLQEAVRDMYEQSPKPAIYYPVQLAYLKAYWRSSKKIHEGSLSNLLFYTGRQLRNNFIMLNVADRMRLYEQRLSQYFDVYHELLFSNKLDAYPAIKERVIAQSLSLKKLLTDGNQVPDELLLRTKDSLSVNILETLRKLKQETSLHLQNSRMRNKYDIRATKLQDAMQEIWLSQLEKAGMDSLVQLTEWKNISGLLKPQQVYTETIRYTKWLSDSTAYYGALVILPGNKMELLNLYSETTVATLLKDPTASPQTAALGTNSTRGLIVKQSDTASKKFQKGSIDKLGELLLQPLWPYLQDKKEWLLVQDGMLNRISFAALQWKYKYLFHYIHLKQLSGSYSLSLKELPMPAKGNVLLAGGLTYGDAGIDVKNKLFNNTYNWDYLLGTKQEAEKLQQQFAKKGYHTKLLTGTQFSDTVITTLPTYPFIHIASHGFYVDSIAAKESYTDSWNKEAVKYEPLFRCGIALSNANNPDTSINENSRGYLMGFELANLDLRKCYLISLSACETGLGDVRNNLGVDGLSRALKLSGARHLLISLWKVPDKPTAFFMDQFYQHLLAGKSPSVSLQLTQLLMSKSYEAKDWAAFVLVE